LDRAARSSDVSSQELAEKLKHEEDMDKRDVNRGRKCVHIFGITGALVLVERRLCVLRLQELRGFTFSA
jgi:hypothetical protein